MRVIRRTFSNLPLTTLLLGREGENLVTRIEVDVSKETKKYEEPTFELELKMPVSEDPYPVVIDVIDDKVCYTFSGSDLNKSGIGELELLVFSKNGEILKSATAKTKINPSIIPTEYPGPLQKVIDDILEKIGEIEGIETVQTPSELKQDAEDGSVAVALNSDDSNPKGLYVKLGTWKRALLDNPIVDDVTLLGLTTYENLVIRDEVLPDSIQDVPVFACGDIDLGSPFIRIVDANENYISLNDIDDADGLPVRYIKTNFNETIKVWFPVATSPVSSAISYPQGWSEVGVSTTAPSFEGFTPTHIEYKNTSYTDVGTLPAVVKSALRSLSQSINVSKEAMGSIYIPEDSVARFNGTIEPNRKYYFNTTRDFSLDLPTVPFAEEDAQFAVYLKTGRGADMALPADTLVSGEIDTSDGNHKVIGCYDKTVNKWCIGCVDYEVAE